MAISLVMTAWGSKYQSLIRLYKYTVIIKKEILSVIERKLSNSEHDRESEEGQFEKHSH